MNKRTNIGREGGSGRRAVVRTLVFARYAVSGER
jgi:hypothetical protein